MEQITLILMEEQTDQVAIAMIMVTTKIIIMEMDFQLEVAQHL